MIRTSAAILLFLSPFLALPASAQDVGPTSEKIRRAVDRSLPFLEKEGVAWIQKRACLSCHHVPFLLWSHREAQERGFDLDPKKLAGWSDWSLKDSLSLRVKVKLADAGLEALKGEAMAAETLAKLAPLLKKPAVKEEDFVKELRKTLSSEELGQHQAALLKHASREKGDGGGLDTMGQLLLAGVYGSGGSQETEFTAATRLRISELQQADGSWKPGGQLFSLTRSAAEATEVTTMWTIVALKGSGEPDSRSAESITRALAFLKNAKPGKTNEELALRLLVEKNFGKPDAARGLFKELLGRQNPDGGWAWLYGGASDAFATGEVLYAIDVFGAADAGESLQRARKYLVETQGEDGSWPIPVLALHASAKPARLPTLEPIFRYWGSAWATIGLLRALPGKS